MKAGKGCGIGRGEKGTSKHSSGEGEGKWVDFALEILSCWEEGGGRVVGSVLYLLYIGCVLVWFGGEWIVGMTVVEWVDVA